jgi:hypothetical protein
MITAKLDFRDGPHVTRHGCAQNLGKRYLQKGSPSVWPLGVK